MSPTEVTAFIASERKKWRSILDETTPDAR
jgi:hypothetical protein